MDSKTNEVSPIGLKCSGIVDRIGIFADVHLRRFDSRKEPASSSSAGKSLLKRAPAVQSGPKRRFATCTGAGAGARGY